MRSAVADPGDDGTPSASAADETGLERVNAYVQPSIVYEGVEWTGYVYDTFNKRYLKNGHAFVIDTQCTGFVVNPDGYIATAGHCVDPKGDITDMFVAAGAQWAVNTGYYADKTLTADDVVGFGDYRIEGEDTKNRGPDRAITVAWGATASGLQASQQKTARVIDFQAFDKGDAALLKVEETDLNALKLSTDAEVDVGTEVVSIGYPASVDLHRPGPVAELQGRLDQLGQDCPERSAHRVRDLGRGLGRHEWRSDGQPRRRGHRLQQLRHLGRGATVQLRPAGRDDPGADGERRSGERGQRHQ